MLGFGLEKEGKSNHFRWDVYFPGLTVVLPLHFHLMGNHGVVGFSTRLFSGW